MRRRLTPFVQVAFGLLASSLLHPPALLAQHAGLGGSTSPAHFGGQVHVGPAPSLPGPSRSSGLPSGPMALRPGVRFPSSPIREGQYRPPTGPAPSHRADNDRHGVGYRTHNPQIYAGYTWLNSFGYGLPVAYGGLPYDSGQEDTGGPQPGPQQADYGDQPPADYAPGPPAPQVADNAPLTFRPAYQGQGDNAPVGAQPATTLIFKDGRPPVQVHNYALTANTLYALDGDSRKEIPLSLLNVQATVEANRAAGVDFALPTSR
jgi:hypothetical protein